GMFTSSQIFSGEIAIADPMIASTMTTVAPFDGQTLEADFSVKANAVGSTRYTITVAEPFLPYRRYLGAAVITVGHPPADAGVANDGGTGGGGDGGTSLVPPN